MLSYTEFLLKGVYLCSSQLLGYGKNPYELQEYNPSFPSSWQIMCQMKLIL